MPRDDPGPSQEVHRKSNPAGLLPSIVSLLRLLSLLIVNYLASHFEPHLAMLVRGDEASPPGAVPRILIWLSLGAVFALPVFELATLLQPFVELVAPASWGLVDRLLTTF